MIVVALALVHALRGSSHPKAVASAPVVKVVVPEGKTRLQIAQIAAAAGLTGSYRADSRHSPLLDPAHYGAPPDTDDLEGFLFPATYDMDPGANVSRLVNEQLLAFQERFGASEISSAPGLHVTPYQLLIVASMVEREALIAHDRPLIAAVIYNRLRQGMPLGIDATIYYAVELADGDRHLHPRTDHRAAAHRISVQHPYPHRSTSDTDLQPGHGLHRSRRASGPSSLPVLRRRRRRLRRAGFLDHLRAVRTQRRRLPGGGRQERRASPDLQEQVMPRLGVLGWPVAHSRSPAIHNAALRSLGMTDWRYQRLPVPPQLFAETTRSLRASGFVGANVTIPHKQAALELADRPSEAASAIGAANTLMFAEDGTIAAENTDAPGLMAALGGSPREMRVLILGAGGSARAAAWALRQAGAREVSVWNRTPERAVALARDLDVRAVRAPVRADLLINCTSVGLERAARAPGHEAPASQPPIAGSARSAAEPDTLTELGLSADRVADYPCVVDMVYRADGPTQLLALAAAQGARTIDGIEILLAQGAVSFELWTGREAPVEVMRGALRGDSAA